MAQVDIEELGPPCKQRGALEAHAGPGRAGDEAVPDGVGDELPLPPADEVGAHDDGGGDGEQEDEGR